MRAPVLFYWGGGVLAVILAIIGNETIETLVESVRFRNGIEENKADEEAA
jgi:hypothetical protein